MAAGRRRRLDRRQPRREARAARPAFPSAARSIRLAPGPRSSEVRGRQNPVAVGHGAVWVGRANGADRARRSRDTGWSRTVPVGNSPSAIATGAGGVWVADDDRQHRDPDRPRQRQRGHGDDPGRAGAGGGRRRRGRGVGREHPGRHRLAHRSAHGGGDADDRGGSRPTGIAAGEGAVWVANSLGGTVSRIDPETNRGRGDGRGRRGSAGRHRRARPRLGHRPGERGAARRPVGAAARMSRGSLLAGATPAPPIRRSTSTCQRLSRPARSSTTTRTARSPWAPAAARGGGGRARSSRTTGGPTRSAIRPGFRFSPPSDEPVTAAAFERAIERASARGSARTAASRSWTYRRRQRLRAGRTKPPRRRERARRRRWSFG